MATERVATEWGFFQSGGTGSAKRSVRGLLPDLEERERALGIRPGQPFLLRPDGSPDVDVLLYFDSPSFRRLSLGSQTAYAYDLRVHLSFLSSQGVDWRDATEEHLLDYEYWRQRDKRNPRRVGGAKFARELTACRRFYEWQQSRGVISPSPVGAEVKAASLRPSNTRPPRMKWLTPAAYREWCNVGLAGYRTDDSYDESWRGRNAGRNLAFAETLWSSGLRLREAGTLLVGELPCSECSGYPAARLAEAVAKGQGRVYWISRHALAAIRTYRKWSRADAVRRAQEQDRYADVTDIWIMMSVTKDRQMIYRDQHSHDEKVVSLDSLGADERRRVFVEGEHGVEPAMVWLTETGLPMPHTTWQKVFQVANARCAAEGLADLSCNPNALRHSFALRWLCVFMWEQEGRFGLTPQERYEMLRTFGDPFAMVSQLLGHSSRDTTEQIYLDVFLNEAVGKFESAQGPGFRADDSIEPGLLPWDAGEDGEV